MGKLYPLVIVLFLFVGCATLTKGPNQTIPVTSEPPGAHVLVGDRVLGLTPLKARLPRKTGHLVEIEKPGYHPQSFEVRSVPNEAATAFIRFGIDRMIGADRDLDVSSIHARLDPTMLPDGDARGRVRELAAKVVAVDERFHQGEIGEEEHRYLLRRLVEAYGQR